MPATHGHQFGQPPSFAGAGPSGPVPSGAGPSGDGPSGVVTFADPFPSSRSNGSEKGAIPKQRLPATKRPRVYHVISDSEDSE